MAISGVKFELGDILRFLKLGLSKKKIREKLGISKSNFSYYLDKLEALGCIKRLGRYRIEVLQSSIEHPRVTSNLIEKRLNKRGHAFNFKVIFPMELNLIEKPAVKRLVAEKKATILPFGSVRLEREKTTIWINKRSITIYTSKSYFCENTLDSKFKSLQDTDFLVQDMKYKLGFNGLYGIEVFREHYGLIFNKFAEWILSKNRKMEVKNKNNKAILWVDDSKEDDIGLKEFEGSNAIDINNADKFFKSHEATNWKVTPEFTLEAINKLTSGLAENNAQLLEYKEQNKEHLELIKLYEEESKTNREVMLAILKKLNS